MLGQSRGKRPVANPLNQTLIVELRPSGPESCFVDVCKLCLVLEQERMPAAEEEPQSQARAKWSHFTPLSLAYLSLILSAPHHRKSQTEHSEVNRRPGEDLSCLLPPSLFPPHLYK